MERPPPYPLVLEPILMEKVWGGRRLEGYGKKLPPGKLIGESWEVADLPATSPSGAGGGAVRSVIANGPLAGRTLHDALALWGEDLLGQRAPGEGCPLLVKFLDARENLSVQVHPSPAYAAAHPGAHIKTECWYVLQSEPGSLIYKGTRPGITRERLARDVEQGRVVESLIAVPAIAGECHTLPSGTCHALGAGVLIAEVQTPSDTTFRLYDWDRSGRALHIREALECVVLGPAPPTTRWAAEHAKARGVVLARTDSFTISEVRARDWSPESADVLIGIEGTGTIGPLRHQRNKGRPANPPFEPVSLPPGTTVVIPRALDGRWEIDPGASDIRYLAVSLAPPSTSDIRHPTSDIPSGIVSP